MRACGFSPRVQVPCARAGLARACRFDPRVQVSGAHSVDPPADVELRAVDSCTRGRFLRALWAHAHVSRSRARYLHPRLQVSCARAGLTRACRLDPRVQVGPARAGFIRALGRSARGRRTPRGRFLHALSIPASTPGSRARFPQSRTLYSPATAGFVRARVA